MIRIVEDKKSKNSNKVRPLYTDHQWELQAPPESGQSMPTASCSFDSREMAFQEISFRLFFLVWYVWGRMTQVAAYGRSSAWWLKRLVVHGCVQLDVSIHCLNLSFAAVS